MTIKSEVVKGVKWTTIGTIVLAVVALLKISILARFLDKADFGLMAIVVFVIGFMDLFNDMGLTSAILHVKTITRYEYASLYWLNFIISFFLFGLLLLITPFIVTFYNQPELGILIPLLGLNLIFSAIGRQYKTIETKHLLFKSISIIDMVVALVSLIFAVILAVKDYGVYSLVYSALLQYLGTNLFYFIYGVRKNGLLFHFNFVETKVFLKIGMYQVGSQVVNYFNRDLDILIIGRVFSTEVLGGYSLAKQLVFRPSQVINPVLTKVAAPVLVKFQHDIDLLKLNYLRLVKIVASINIPVYLLLLVFAPVAVSIFYGEGFLDIVYLVRILSVYMIFRAIGNPVGSLVIATGRTDLELFWNLIVLCVSPLFLLIGSQFGIMEVAFSITLSMIVLYIPSWKFLVYKMVKISFSDYVKSCFIIVSPLKLVKLLLK